MASALAKRVFQLEKRMAEITDKLTICNCRFFKTRFHNADCLDAIMKGINLVCPRHGFRCLGRFWFTAEWYPLFSAPRGHRFRDEVDQLCPCPPHPWRSYIRNRPGTWEARELAWEAWQNLPPTDGTNLQEENKRIHLICSAYYESARQWLRENPHCGLRIPE